MLRALDQHRVAFVLVGTLAGVARGAPEETDVVEICPSLREDNLQRLDAALATLAARPLDDGPGAVARISRADTRRFETDWGELVVDAEPDGTHGYDELRRGGTRERLDAGLNVSIASLPDLLRVLRAREPGEETQRVQLYRRLAELTQQVQRGPGIEL
jgi:hypothetical protein